MSADIVESSCPADGRWTSGALGILVQRVAAQPSLWEDALVRHPDQRWFGNLIDTEKVELRPYTWPRGTSTQLHDHGGSIGAYAVVEGTLTEHWYYDVVAGALTPVRVAQAAPCPVPVVP